MGFPTLAERTASSTVHVLQAADLRFSPEGALESDPEQPCNAVSFGWRIDWQEENLPTTHDDQAKPQLRDLRPSL